MLFDGGSDSNGKQAGVESPKLSTSYAVFLFVFCFFNESITIDKATTHTARVFYLQKL